MSENINNIIPDHSEKVSDGLLDFVRNDELLRQDALTIEMIENGFNIGGVEMDPENWIAERKKILENDKKEGRTMAELKGKFEEDNQLRRPD